MGTVPQRIAPSPPDKPKDENPDPKGFPFIERARGHFLCQFISPGGWTGRQEMQVNTGEPVLHGRHRSLKVRLVEGPPPR